MRQWWQGLARREQRILLAGAAALALMLGYLLVWEPLHQGVLRLERSTAEQQAVLQWMQRSAQQARALSGVARVDSAMRGSESAQALIERTARSSGLAEGYKQTRQAAENELLVSFEAVGFDELVVWLDQLQQVYGLELVVAELDRVQPGRVNARLTLRDPS